MDLIREILLKVEEAPAGAAIVGLPIKNHNRAKVSEHCYLLSEAGLLDIKEGELVNGRRRYDPVRLTWEGHEFLADIKNETRWKAAKKLIASISGASILVAKQVAAKLSAEQAEILLKKLF